MAYSTSVDWLPPPDEVEVAVPASVCFFFFLPNILENKDIFSPENRWNIFHFNLARRNTVLQEETGDENLTWILCLTHFDAFFKISAVLTIVKC